MHTARNIDHDSLGNVYQNGIKNVEAIFRQYAFEYLGFRISQYYNEIIPLPRPRSIAIELENPTADLRSWIGTKKRNYLLHMNFNIIYFHEQPETDARRKEVQQVLWKITEMLMQYASLNGFCTPLGSQIIGSDYISHPYRQTMMSAGLVRLYAKKLHSVIDVA